MPKRREDPHAKHIGQTAASIAQTAGPLAEHAQAAATVDPAATYRRSDWTDSSLWISPARAPFPLIIDGRTNPPSPIQDTKSCL